jgi:pSer/pThr/pTyr-binding forkhead associated (FHA) protein
LPSQDVMHRQAIVTRVGADETVSLPILDETAFPRTSFLLRVVSGHEAGSVITLDPTSPPHVVLGQASSCTMRLSDPHVSRRHLAFTATPNHVLVVDLGSRNGTFVNGVLVREARLYGGESIRIGRTILGVESDTLEEANRASTVPPPPLQVVAAEETKPTAQNDFLTSVLSERLPFPDARQRVMSEFERRFVEDLLARHNGNVTHAARASGIAHRYFQLVRARSR